MPDVGYVCRKRGKKVALAVLEKADAKKKLEETEKRAGKNSKGKEKVEKKILTEGKGPMGELADAAALRDSGVLNDDEFAATKAKILSKMQTLA